LPSSGDREDEETEAVEEGDESTREGVGEVEEIRREDIVREVRVAGGGATEDKKLGSDKIDGTEVEGAAAAESEMDPELTADTERAETDAETGEAEEDKEIREGYRLRGRAGTGPGRRKSD
jgi:hypothetical protein